MILTRKKTRKEYKWTHYNLTKPSVSTAKNLVETVAKCDLRLYCYLSPSERPDELVSLVIDFLHNHIENHGHYTHRSAASFPCIDDMDMSTAVGGDRYQKPHTLHKRSRACEARR